MIDTPKNLTRNILLGMLLGFVVGAIFYYLEIFPQGIKNFVSMYIPFDFADAKPHPQPMIKPAIDMFDHAVHLNPRRPVAKAGRQL